MIKQKGQTALEFLVVIIVVLGALLAMSNYFKRGVQGRWKAAVDELGDQYDPAYMDSRTMRVMASNTETRIWTVPADDAEGDGYWTLRRDDTDVVETQYGNVRVGTAAR